MKSRCSFAWSIVGQAVLDGDRLIGCFDMGPRRSTRVDWVRHPMETVSSGTYLSTPPSNQSTQESAMKFIIESLFGGRDFDLAPNGGPCTSGASRFRISPSACLRRTRAFASRERPGVPRCHHVGPKCIFGSHDHAGTRICSWWSRNQEWDVHSNDTSQARRRRTRMSPLSATSPAGAGT